MSARSKRVGEIELFRFVFIVIVMLLHSGYFIDEGRIFVGGAFGVEFFFMLSGYLLMASVDKIKGVPIQGDLGTETLRFLRKKVSAFYPEVLVSTVLGCLVYVATTKPTIRELINRLGEMIWEVLLLEQTGLDTGGMNAPVWYLSALLIATAMLYPLLRKDTGIVRKIILPLMMLFLFGYLCRNFDNLYTPNKWLGFAKKGLLRGSAEMILGISLYQIVERIKSLHFSKKGMFILSLVKWGSYASVILYMWKEWDRKYDYFFLLVFAIAVGLSFSRKTIDSFLFDNKVCYFLGDISLSVYLNHFCWAIYLQHPDFSGKQHHEKLFMYLALTAMTTTIGFLASKLLRKCIPYGKKKLAKLFFNCV